MKRNKDLCYINVCPQACFNFLRLRCMIKRHDIITVQCELHVLTNASLSFGLDKSSVPKNCLQTATKSGWGCTSSPNALAIPEIADIALC